MGTKELVFLVESRAAKHQLETHTLPIHHKVTVP